MTEEGHECKTVAIPTPRDHRGAQELEPVVGSLPGLDWGLAADWLEGQGSISSTARLKPTGAVFRGLALLLRQETKGQYWGLNKVCPLWCTCQGFLAEGLAVTQCEGLG